MSLKERCGQLKLFDCETSNSYDLAEKVAKAEIYEHDPDFYEAIEPFVPFIPDLRPKKTLKRMAVKRDGETILERQNNWWIVFKELEALGRKDPEDSFEGEEDRMLFDAINSGNPVEIRPYADDPEKRRVVERFLITYPSLIFLSTKISPRNTIIPLLISQGRLDLIDDVKLQSSDISFIRDRKTAQQMYNLFSNLGIDDRGLGKEFIFMEAVRHGEVGDIYWILVEGKVDPGMHRNEALIVAIREDYPLVVKALLEDNRVDPADRTNYALRLASVSGGIEIMEMLLANERVDPTAENNEPLRDAIAFRRVEKVKLLLKDARVRSKVKTYYLEILDPDREVDREILDLVYDYGLIKEKWW